MNYLRPAADRGHAYFGWLDSRHSFSFGSYYDPAHMGVSALRVINDDKVTPGAGFDTHGHRDMEILSYVLDGAIEHKDSMGHKQTITAGEFQIMSAGTGVTHSEYNGSDTNPLRFLQIWLLPNEQSVTPKYDQKAFEDFEGLTPVIHPTADGAMRAHTDARVYRYQGTKPVEFALASEANHKTVYVHAVKSSVTVNGQTLEPGDGFAIAQEQVTIEGQADSEALVFELP